MKYSEEIMGSISCRVEQKTASSRRGMKMMSRETVTLVKRVPVTHIATATAPQTNRQAAIELKSRMSRLNPLTATAGPRNRKPASDSRVETTAAAASQVITAAKKLKNSETRLLGIAW